MTDFVKPKLPFKIVSSSVDTGYITEISSGFKSGVDIVGLHQDTYAGLENEPLQSPFTKYHVGGNQHRHASLNLGTDNDLNRAEAFKIKPESSTLKIYGPDFESVNKPRAQMWKGAKSPVNIENINSSNRIVGNFDKNYQVIQTSGRGITNNLIVDDFVASGNLTTQFVSGASNYSLPNLTANTKTTFVERFNAPGGKQESSRGSLERYGEELSPNNSLTTRNIKVRQPFYNQLTQHSAQFGSGSSEGISIHKVNRNSFRKIKFSGSSETDYISSSLQDNFWIQHSIPQDNFGYAWITASSISNPYTIGNSALEFAFTSSLNNSSIINITNQTLSLISEDMQRYAQYSQGLDLFVLNIAGPIGNTFSFRVFIGQPSNSILVVDNNIDLSFTNSEEVTSYDIDNLVNNPSNWPGNIQLFNYYRDSEDIEYYGGSTTTYNFSGASEIEQISYFNFYGTREQIRTGEHPVAQALRNKNIISVENIPQTKTLNNNSSITSKRSGTSTNYSEPPVTNKYFPLQQDLIFNGDIEGTGTRIKYSLANIVDKFANKNLNKRLGLQKTKISQIEFYNKLLEANNLSVGSPIQEVLSIKYKEKLYPSQINTFLSGTRARDQYILNIPGTGSEGFDRQLGTQRTFWRNEQTNRKRSNLSDGGYINSVGLSSTDEIGNSFNIVETGSLIDESIFNYQSTLNVDSNGLNRGFFNSISTLESSSLQEKYSSIQIINVSGTQIFSRKRAVIGGLSGEYNEGYVDFYGIGQEKEDLTTGIGAIYKNSLYKTALTDRPYVSGSPEDLRDLVTLVHTEDDKVNINPKTRYVAFIGGAELSTGSATFYNTASNIFSDPNINIDSNSIIYSTMDNGLIRTAESASGKTPFFDSYEDFISDIRGYAKDYSVIPEFRISNHIKYYVSSSGANFRNKNNSIFELDGNGISQRSSLSEGSDFNTTFLEKYNFSDDLNINKTIENDYSDELSPNNITLTCKGIKKLLPYNGFYPQDRTIQLANLYSEYVDSNLVGGTYNVSYENTVGADEIFSHAGTTSSLGRVSSMSSIQFNNVYYIAVSYNYYQNNRGVVRLFSSSVSLPYEQWQQLNFIEYTGDSTGSYFGQSVVMLTSSNGINLFVSEYGITKTGSLYQITSSNGVDWSVKTKILDSSLALAISGNEGAYFGNHIDGISDNQRTVLAVTEPGLPLNLNNTVNSIYVSGTDLYVGGAFTNVNKNSNSNYIVKYDTLNSSWSNLGTGPNNLVYAITGSGNDIYVGGLFSSVNGNTSIRRLAKRDTLTNTWSSLSGLSELNNWISINALCLSGTDLYIGGNSSVSQYQNILKYNLSTNTVSFLGNPVFQNGVNGQVNTISVSGTDLYVGGAFTTATDSTGIKECNYIAKWNTLTNVWSNLNLSTLNQEGAGGNTFISASDKAAGDTFGNAVAINGNGNRIVVGATGSAYGGPISNLYTMNTLGFSTTSFSPYYTPFYSASIYFGNSGFNFYLINSENNIQRFSITTPYDLNTGLTLIQNIGFLGSLYGLKALAYKDDGTKIYVAAKSSPLTNIESDTIFQYAVSPSWGAPVAGEGSFSISSISAVAYDSYITGIVFNSTGTRMFVSHTNNGTLGNGPAIYDPSDLRNIFQAAISEFTLSTPWSVSSAVHVTTLNLQTFYSGDVKDIKGLNIDTTGKELFFVGEANFNSNYIASFYLRNGQLNTAGLTVNYRDASSLSAYLYTGVYVNPSKNRIIYYDSIQKRATTFNISTRSFTEVGKAYVYTSGSTGWVQEGVGGNPYFTGSRTSDDELYFSTKFGSSVAISSNGNRIAVAERNGIVQSLGGPVGKINVYNSSSIGWQNDNYTYLSTNFPYLVTHAFPGYPESLDISEDGSRIIAGSPQYDSGKGSVYIWISGSSVGWVLEKDTSPYGGSSIITSSLHNSSTNAKFGSSVAISSVGVPRIIVGAPQVSVGGVFSGRVHIFNSSSAGWSEENIGANAFISSSDKAAGDRFGFSVAINSAGNRIAVGASESTVSGISQAGKVYIFNSSSIGWTQEIHSGSTPFISPVTKVTNENFGYSVKLDSAGNRLVVATESESGVVGNTYVFTSSSIGWTQEVGNSVNSTIRPSDGATADQFGFSVDINSSGDRIVVGSRNADPASVANSGKTYIFTTPDVTRFRSSPAGINSTVDSIVVSGTDIYAGGAFTADKNGIESYQYILKYQPTTNKFSSVGNGLNNTVFQLIRSGSDIYAGGSFTTTGSYVSKWNGTTWSSPITNLLNNTVRSIAFSGNYMYFGGDFTNPTQRFAAYNTSTSTWLQSNGIVYVITSSNNSSWSPKRSVISGSGFAKYSSIISASNGYHVFCTDESSTSGSIRVVTSSNASVWSSGSLGAGIVITNGTTSTANLGQLPIDSTVFISGGIERAYVFTADIGSNTYGSFYVFSSSVGSSWGNTNIDSLKTILLTGSVSNNLIPNDLSTTKTNLNISSIAHSAALYYSYGTARAVNSLLYTGKTLNGTSWEQQTQLYSVSKNAYFGDNIDISTFLSKPVFFTSDEDNVYSLLSGKFATYRLNVVDKQKFKKFAALEPFFAPGILYNTIKSGIAVDWPCTTGSNSIVTSSAEYGLRTIYYPKNYVVKTRFDESTGQTYNAIGSLKSNINYRIPFENILFPNEAFETKPELFVDLEAKRLAEDPAINISNIVNTYLEKTYIYGGYEPYMNPIDFGDFNEFGPKRFSVPFVYRKDKTSDSGLYTLATSNFLSEIVKFFLKDEKLITFKSNPDNKWKQFQQNKTYCMDVVIEKSPELVMMEAYSSSLQPGTMNGRYFGYPVNKTDKDIWTGEEFTTSEKEVIHTDPAYAPYTPPYFEGIARARILFTPTQSRAYTLDEILREATIENIYSAVEDSASENSDALLNKMPLESSIDLRGVIQSVNVTIQTDKNSQEVAENNNKIWVISPKLETPVLDFANQEKISYENTYIKKSGYGRGMWSGYGSVPNSGKGIKIRLEYPFGRNRIDSLLTGSLLEQVGFQAEEKFVGRISDNKQVSEAVIAIPYLTQETDQTVTNSNSFKQSDIHFIKIDKNIFDLQLKNIENNLPAIQASEDEGSVDIQNTSISEMINMMKNYVIPPELNFLQYSDIEPFIMYMFEFKHTFEQQDLVDIWQGLKPQISISAEEDEIKINHKLGQYEFFGNQPIPSNIKWLVFKVKKKAEFNYFNVTETTKDDKRFNFNKIVGREEGTDVYSYNWPYDYFSLVELAKLDVEIEYKKKKV